MATIAVDVMGGDYGLPVTLPGSVASLMESMAQAGSVSPFELLLVGEQQRVSAALDNLLSRDRLFKKQANQLRERIEIIHADQVVDMDESPRAAMRTKKRSSMRIALDLVKSGHAQAAVSAGNTGALVAISRYLLKTFPNIVRPAIVSKIPTHQGHCYMLDLGGNVDTSARHLYQFAAMGAMLSSALDQVEQPRVGLLNIGEEEIKGNEQVKGAHALLQQAHWLNYIGYIEGDAVYSGVADVVVCDGFVGNVALKSSEGAARFIASVMKDEINRHKRYQLLALLMAPVLKAVKRRIDPGQYNGATLVGLRGNVVKSHGGADEAGFKAAVTLAAQEAEKNIAHLIGERLASLTASLSASL